MVISRFRLRVAAAVVALVAAAPAGAQQEYPATLYWGSGLLASHGTPHDYDARVPVLFYGPWFNTGHFDTPARVVDMAPTLAAVLGVKPLERLDGRVLMSAIRVR